MFNTVEKYTENVRKEFLSALKSLMENENSNICSTSIYNIIRDVFRHDIDLEIDSEQQMLMVKNICYHLNRDINDMLLNYVNEKSKKLNEIDDKADFVAGYVKVSADLMIRAKLLNCFSVHLFTLILESSFESKRDKKTYTLIMDSWIDKMFHKSTRIVPSICELIDCERKETGSHEDVIVKAIKQILATSNQTRVRINKPFYCAHFEKELCSRLTEYYEKEATTYMSQHTISEYLNWAQKLIETERNLFKRYFGKISAAKTTAVLLDRICKDSLVDFNASKIGEYFVQVFESRNQNSLKIVYTFMNFTSKSLNDLKHVYDCQIAKEIANEKSRISNLDEESFFSKISEFLLYHENMLENCFENDNSFRDTLRNNFQKLFCVGAEGSDMIMKTLKYCDVTLRKVSRSDSDEDKNTFQVAVRQIVTIVKYLTNLDEFVLKYIKLFSQRFLRNRFSLENEKFLIAEFEKIIMKTISYKLTRLVPDLKKSQQLNATFSEQISSSVTFPINWTILCDAYWLISTSSASNNILAHLPSRFSAIAEQFELFYKSQHKTHKLTWVWSASSVELVSHCFHKQYVFLANMFQTMILLEFDRSDSLSLAQLRQKTGFTDVDELKSHLMQLCSANILIQSSSSASSSSSSNTSSDQIIFTLNFNYRNVTGLRVNLTILSLEKQAMTENNDEIKYLEISRKIWIQASAIRLMKAFKKCTKNNLYDRICNDLKTKYCPKVSEISKQVDILVEKGYLEFTDNIYTYVT